LLTVRPPTERGADHHAERVGRDGGLGQSRIGHRQLGGDHGEL